MPFVEGIENMTEYEKFLKYIISNTNELEKVSKVVLNKQCPTNFREGIPVKMEDPGCLKLPCEFGNSTKKYLGRFGNKYKSNALLFIQKVGFTETKYH